MSEITLGKIAEHIGARLIGSAETKITGAMTLDKAGPGEITFLSNPKYENAAKATAAEAVIAASEIDTEADLLIVEDPYYGFMQSVVLLHGHREHPKIGISKQASVADSAKVGQGTNVHPFARICEDAKVGKRCEIYPGVFIGAGSVVGDDCILYPNSVVYDDSVLGDRVILQGCSVIGQDGFGFSTHKGVHHKIPQIGRAVLEDDVEIGSCAVVERGTLDDTIIGKGSKIGDAVAIGHGTKVGPYCLMVPQVAVAGSVNIGHHCVFGGQVGVVGHITIGDEVIVGAQAGVTGNVPSKSVVMGAPAIEVTKGKRAYALIEFLPEIRKKIRSMEKEITSLKAKVAEKK